MTTARATVATALLGLALAAPAASQQPGKVIPLWTEFDDGNDGSTQPFEFDKGRVQQIWLRRVVANFVGVINRIQYRRDARESREFEPHTRSLKVSLGYASRPPEWISTTFAENRAGALTEMFNGTVSLPRQPPVNGIGPWNIEFDLVGPFFYDPSMGHLLMEIETEGRTPASRDYVVDAVRTSQWGQTGVFGQTGSFAGGDLVTHSMSGGLGIGMNMILGADGMLQPYPAVVAIGTTNRFWNGLGLPIDLTVLGAPGNNLYMGPDLILPLPVGLVMGGTTYEGRLEFNLPNRRSLTNTAFYSQVFCVDPPSNALGIVATNAAVVGIGGGPSTTAVLSAPDSTALSGSTVYGSGDIGGPVVRFVGTFN